MSDGVDDVARVELGELAALRPGLVPVQVVVRLRLLEVVEFGPEIRAALCVMGSEKSTRKTDEVSENMQTDTWIDLKKTNLFF